LYHRGGEKIHTVEDELFRVNGIVLVVRIFARLEIFAGDVEVDFVFIELNDRSIQGFVLCFPLSFYSCFDHGKAELERLFCYFGLLNQLFVAGLL
jgi:hypothetical protein